MGIASISLEETAMGRPLYEKYDFIKMNDEMELPEWSKAKAVVTFYITAYFWRNRSDKALHLEIADAWIGESTGLTGAIPECKKF